MTDYCLMNVDQAAFDALMLSTGLGVEGVDAYGNPCVQPCEDVYFDRIGPITWNGGTYPEYHTNLRVMYPLSDEQLSAISKFVVNPPQPQYRVWAQTES